MKVKTMHRSLLLVSLRIAGRAATAALVALALCGGSAAEAHAQGRGLPGPDAAYIGLGISGIAMGELNDELQARGYPTFGRTAVAPSLGAYWRLPGGILFGAEWVGLILGEEEHEGGEVGLGGGYGTFGVGYAVELSPGIRVYPRLGLGGGGFGLWIEGPENPTPFDEVLVDPAPRPDREVVLNRDGVVVDLGAGAELLPGGPGGGLMIALRVGYLAAPWDGEWQLDGSPVSGGPDASIAGPYLRLMAGWAWGR